MLLAGTGCFALVLPVRAQDGMAAGNVVRAEVVLDATAPNQGDVVPTIQIVTKTKAIVLDTRQSVSVVTAQQMQDQGATLVGQALRYGADAVAQP